MKKHVCLTFISLLLFNGVVFAYPDCEGVHLGRYTDSNGVQTLYCASYDLVLETPEWDGVSDYLPLRMSEAIRIGEAWLKERNPKLDDFDLDEITISKIRNSRIQDRWHYELEFQTILDGRALFGSPFTVKILMDGTVVEPEVSQD